MEVSQAVSSSDARHTITIEFCVPCDFRPQAVEATREVLDGWAHQLRSLELLPSSGGRFEVTLDGQTVFSKASLDRHLEPGELHVLLRDRIGPPLVEG